MFYYVQDLDGLGDRPDIALERDRSWEDRITYRDHQFELLDFLDRSDEWGDDDSPSIKTAIDRAIDNGSNHLKIFKKDYKFDFSDLEALRYEILIERGWACEDFQIIRHEHCSVFEFDISLLYGDEK